MLGEVLDGQIDRHAGSDRDVNQLRVHAFGVQIDSDRATGTGHAVEYGAPEIMGAFRDAALNMDTQRHTCNLRNGP